MNTSIRLLFLVFVVVCGLNFANSRPAEIITTDEGLYEITFYTERITEKTTPYLDIEFNNYIACEHNNVSRITRYHITWIYKPNNTVIIDTRNATIRPPKHIRFFDDYSLEIKKEMRDVEFFDYACIIIGPKDPNEDNETERLFMDPNDFTTEPELEYRKKRELARFIEKTNEVIKYDTEKQTKTSSKSNPKNGSPKCHILPYAFDIYNTKEEGEAEIVLNIIPSKERVLEMSEELMAIKKLSKANPILRQYWCEKQKRAITGGAYLDTDDSADAFFSYMDKFEEMCTPNSKKSTTFKIRPKSFDDVVKECWLKLSGTKSDLFKGLSGWPFEDWKFYDEAIECALDCFFPRKSNKNKRSIRSIGGYQQEEIEELFPSIAVQTLEHKVSFIHCNPNRTDAKNYNVRWLKNNRVLLDSSNASVIPPKNIKLHDNYTLEITDIGNEETATYSCQIIGIKNSTTTELVVPQIQNPLTIIRIPESGELEVELLHEVILTCIATLHPMPSVTWFFKNRELLHSKGHKTILKFNATNKNQSGEYRCVVTNGKESEKSASFLVNVLYKPDVVVQKSWIHSAIGERTILSCAVFANPTAKGLMVPRERPDTSIVPSVTQTVTPRILCQSVDWFHEGVPVNLTSRMFLRAINDEHTLTIRNTRSVDFGNYTCQATNFLGRTVERIHISGLANQAQFRPDKEQRTTSTYTLVWEVDSYSPIIQYSLLFRQYDKTEYREWVKLIIPSSDIYNTGPIHMENYMLTGLNPSTMYEAMVSSRNEFGWSFHSSVHRFATENLEQDLQFLTDEEALIQTNNSKMLQSSINFGYFLFIYISFKAISSTCT